MRYSLLSRFQAVLWGIALGQEGGIYSQTGRSIPIASNGDLSGSNFPPRQAPFSNSALINRGLNSEKIVQGIERLIQSRGRVIQSSLAPANSKQDWFAAAVPIALFFHDDEIKLYQALTQTVSPASLVGAMAVSLGIATALREQLQPLDLIPQTIAVLAQWLGSTPSLTDLRQQLEQVQAGLEQNVGLHTMAAKLPSALEPTHRAIAIAFYCFLSTPEDFQLSVLRAVRVDIGAGTWAGAVTGAMAGAHNSTIGIPLDWRLARAASAGQKDTTQADAEELELQLESLASRLWAVWSGALEPAFSRLGSEAIAAPNVIRSR